jgi:tetratricopeptide (TPR) repeat protein
VFRGGIVALAIDREATLKQAEKFLRQGKLDAAIAEYVRLVEDQPRDWNTINALGDLYVRAGNVDRAVEQFTRVADYLFEEGFYPKAGALYKKALKVHSVHEHTLERLGEIAAKQGIIADAKTYFRQLSEQRKFRGDKRGALEAIVRLGSLEEADAETQVAGARAAQQLGDNMRAAGLLKDAAEQLERQNRRGDALLLLVDAAQLDPGDLHLRARLARECVKAGQPERARAFLTRDVAGDDPELLLALARIELAAGKDEEARAAVTRVMTVAPDRHADVAQLALDLAKKGQIERAFGCLDLVTDAALLEGHYERAARTLQAFVKDTPYVPALIKLVEACVDAGLDADMRDAQARLADAYLEDGKGAEAKVIAEDLLEHAPKSEAHLQRLRRALELLGVADIDRQIAERLGEPQPVENLDVITLLETTGIADSLEVLEAIEQPVAMEPPPAEVEIPARVEATVPVAAQAADDDAIVLEAMEIDLSTALANMAAAPAPVLPQVSSPGSSSEPVAPSAPSEPVGPPRDLEHVFEDIRARATRQTSGAAEQYDRALAHIRDGRLADAMSDLQAAARVPAYRFQAAARLGRLYIERGELQPGVDWLERAAEAPAPTRDEGCALLYELADVLERMGETARALAILMELEADAPGYRDIRGRIEQLARSQTGSDGA